jgi:hypothetical protein
VLCQCWRLVSPLAQGLRPSRMTSCSKPRVARMNMHTPTPSYAVVSDQTCLRAASHGETHLMERRMPFSKMLFGTVDVVGHNMSDSYSRAISLGPGSQAAAIVPLMASWTVSCQCLPMYYRLHTHSEQAHQSRSGFWHGQEPWPCHQAIRGPC